MKEELLRLRALLTTDFNAPVSAKELAGWMHCSIPTVYSRLNALARAGVVIVEVREPCSSPGPTPRRYYLARNQTKVP